MTRLFLALIIGSIFPILTYSQVKVVRGHSDAHSGMLFYDVEKANDKQEKRFLYTICPEDARCLQIDFTLMKSALEADFIRLYAGKDAEGEALQNLGGKSLDLLFQYSGSCLTVEFLRDAKGLNTAWSLLWKSEKEGDCIRSGEQDDDCPYVTEICGPEYREPFHLKDEAKLAGVASQGTCIEKPLRSSWYKFVAQKDGGLQFRITPANGKDDLDWVLWRADSTWTDPCPDSLTLADKISCNYAAGKGAVGSTGMAWPGSTYESNPTGDPFAKPIQAQKGDVFFLLVNDYSKESQGFTIKFNEVVLACDNPVRTFVPINHKVVTGRPKIPSRNQFSRYTKILRIDLNEKANQPLIHCDGLQVDWSSPLLPGAKPLGEVRPQFGYGIHAILLTGLKLGRYNAYACEDMATPIHYGDIHQFMKEQGWERTWDISMDEMVNFGNHIELIVDEIFDRNSGRKRQVLRMLRLVWSDPDEQVPDYNLAVFQWKDVEAYLDQVGVPNPHNDVQSLSVKDFLEGQMYTSINIHQRHQDNRTLEDASQGQRQEVEFEAFHWGR